LAIYGPTLFVIYYSLCPSLAEFVKREVLLSKTSLRPSVKLRVVLRQPDEHKGEDCEKNEEELCGGFVHLEIHSYTSECRALCSHPVLMSVDAQGEEITSMRIEIRYPHLPGVHVLKDSDNEDILKALMGIRTDNHLGHLLLLLILPDEHTVRLHSGSFRAMQRLCILVCKVVF
jgi:hypothetical protein